LTAFMPAPSARLARTFQGSSALRAAAAAAATAAMTAAAATAESAVSRPVPQLPARAGPMSSSKPSTKPQPWTEDAQMKLEELVEQLGLQNWHLVASNMPGRTGRQCRERYLMTKSKLKKVGAFVCPIRQLATAKTARIAVYSARSSTCSVHCM
jgi:hypothetical protein